MTRTGESTFRVRYAETDQMGVVHHSNYVIWCELGRTDYMRQLGVDYAALERDGLFLAVAELQLRYGAPARYDDEIRVLTHVERVQSRAVTFAYEVRRAATDERLATGTTRLIATDAHGCTRTLPRAILDCFRDVTDAPAS
ncbi:MAG: acyl-CoA thioesterase [Longimicrobiales bacterium]